MVSIAGLCLFTGSSKSFINKLNYVLFNWLSFVVSYRRKKGWTIFFSLFLAFFFSVTQASGSAFPFSCVPGASNGSSGPAFALPGPLALSSSIFLLRLTAVAKVMAPSSISSRIIFTALLSLFFVSFAVIFVHHLQRSFHFLESMLCLRRWFFKNCLAIHHDAVESRQHFHIVIGA